MAVHRHSIVAVDYDDGVVPVYRLIALSGRTQPAPERLISWGIAVGKFFMVRQLSDPLILQGTTISRNVL